MTVTVCHYPPQCSKYNPIERRLFSQISMNWAGIPLNTLEVMLSYIRGTKTDTGLIVEAFLLEGTYMQGERASEKEIRRLALLPHSVCPEWNYTVMPHADFTIA